MFEKFLKKNQWIVGYILFPFAILQAMIISTVIILPVALFSRKRAKRLMKKFGISDLVPVNSD